MKYNVTEDIRHRPDVIRLKRRFGIMYGMVAGLAFAAASWGIDGYLINKANAFYPWMKFIIVAVICMAAGGLAGWLVARSEKAIVGLRGLQPAKFLQIHPGNALKPIQPGLHGSCRIIGNRSASIEYCHD